eukprot:TRINITY_DN7173_c0_g1_i1.p1 TRINITY_DN7173_c0_g1~~TRINITY_DN7173_c0_g1_i1.p1  ORF type:complete len:116 (+),score=29.15 TRINITY_DN7173_c0_g1_i1:148-495(+)
MCKKKRRKKKKKMPTAPVTVLQVTPVDVDKLWRVRVANELHAAKSWNETYGYMVHGNEERDKMLAENSSMSNTKNYTIGLRTETIKKKEPEPFNQSFDSKVMGPSSFARKKTKWL